MYIITKQKSIATIIILKLLISFKALLKLHFNKFNLTGCSSPNLFTACFLSCCTDLKKKFNKKRWTKKLCLYANYYNLCLLIPTNLYNFFSVTVLKEKLHDYQVFLNDVRHSSLSFIICVLVFFSFYFTPDVSCLNPPMLCWLLISPNSMKDIGKGHGNIHFLHLNISKYFNTWQS